MFEGTKSQLYKQLMSMKTIPAEFSWIFWWPLIGMFSLGLYAVFVVSGGAPVESINFALVGVICWNFFSTAQRGVVYGFLIDIWDECAKHLFLSRMGVGGFTLGSAIFSLFSGLIGLIFIGLVSIPVFGFNIFSAGIHLVGGVLVLLLFATSVGLLINSLLAARGYEWRALSWTIPGLILVLSGVYYPVSLFPEPVRSAALSLPSTYAISSIRNSLSGALDVANVELLYGLFFGIVYLLISYWIFARSVRVGLENGVIASY